MYPYKRGIPYNLSSFVYTVTVNVPLGGESGDETITYYVYETDKDGNLIDKDSFGYVVSGEGKAKVEQGKMNTDISITIRRNQDPADPVIPEIRKIPMDLIRSPTGLKQEITHRSCSI